MNSARHNYIAKKLMEAILFGVQDNGQRIFDKSQRFVPIKRGQLKNSGSFNKKAQGWEIQYSAPYAKNIELGAPSEKIIGTFTYQVPGYIRKGYKRKDGTYIPPSKVRPYRVEMVDQRPVAINTSNGTVFRTLSGWGSKAARLFLTRSIRDGLKELPLDLKKRIDQIRL